MRRTARIVALGAVLAACQGPSFISDRAPTTTAIHPDGAPQLEEVPANPRRVVNMQPGPVQLNEVHRLFVEGEEGYAPGSASIVAVHPGLGDGPLFVLRWTADIPQLGEASCTAVASPSQAPQGVSCSSPVAEPNPFTIGGFSYTTETGLQEFVVEHSPDATAVVIEQSDRTSYLIRPGSSSVLLRRWDGNPPIRFMVFWNNGTTSSEKLSP